MQGTELVVTVALCFTSGGFHISTKISYPVSAGTSVLVCDQSINSYFLTLFESRPSETGRGEGGLLCVRNRFFGFNVDLGPGEYAHRRRGH